jgi:hypothetical protein
VTTQFLTDLAERAVKTFAQALVAVLTVQGVSGVLDVDWPRALSVAGLAAVVSALTSLASGGIGRSGTASLTNAVEPAGRHAAPEA